MDIVACIDKWFVMPTGVMMYSVCVNNPDVDIVFHVIHDDEVTSINRSDLEKTVASFGGKSILFYHIDVTKFPCFPNISSGVGVTKASYYRLLMSEILPENIHKVLYLDGDIIVRHSLLPLWNIDLGNRAVGVVPDGIVTMEFYNRLQYPPQLGYFNAGVILMNLDYWREHEVVNCFMDYLLNHAGILLFHDQDVLNVVFRESKIVLPIKYNLTNGFLWKKTQYDTKKYKHEVLEAREDPVIVHFAGEKPWNSYRRGASHPFASTFFKYQSQTKWKGVIIDKRPFKLRVINYVTDMLRKYGLKSQVPPLYEYIDIAPID